MPCIPRPTDWLAMIEAVPGKRIEQYAAAMCKKTMSVKHCYQVTELNCNCLPLR